MFCTHCGRQVQDTIHGPRSYQVDYYLWLTGEREPTLIKSTDGEGKDKVYVRLVQPRVVVTCVDCWAKPEIRSSLPRSCPDSHEEEGEPRSSRAGA